MTQGKCFGLVRGLVMRATALDGCGRIKAAECSSIVSDGFVSVEFSANSDTADDITVTLASGKQYIHEPGKPQLNGYSLTITFAGVDPQLYAMTTGQRVLFDSDGVAIGFEVDTAIDATETGFALELWSKVPGQACSDTGAGTFGYLLLPFLQGGVFGDFTLENGAVSFQIQNINTQNGNSWGVGPYDVQMDGTGSPGPLLDPVSPTAPLRLIYTEVAPPEPGDCECTANGTEATTATAGAPGTWGPVDSYAPATFDDLTAGSVTATPTTAWTTGQYVVLGDLSSAYWDGTDWQEGTAP